MDNRNVLEAIKIISEYCTLKGCENCEIEDICDEIAIIPCYWGSRIKTIEERITKNETQNK